MTLFYAYLPTFVVTALLLMAERWRSAPPTDWWRNLEAWGLQVIIALTIQPLLAIWEGPGLINTASLPFWAGFILFLLIKDLGEYLFHRAQHRIPALWAMHSLHHSDPEMAVLTTQRHFWGEQLIKQLTIWSATLMLITPTSDIIVAYGLFALVNLVTHCDLPINLGRWSWVINSPAYHRRHHSRLPEHYDSNFAAIFPIFDVLCGTYHRPEGFPPTGLARKPENIGELLVWPLIWDKAPTGDVAQA